MNGHNFLPDQEFKTLILAAALAVFGGLAKLLMSSKRITVYRFASYCIVSGFTGVMASYLVRSMELSLFLQSFIIGMCGFSGPTALSAFTVQCAKKLGIFDDPHASERQHRDRSRSRRTEE
jgi:hypothetical protein